MNIHLRSRDREYYLKCKFKLIVAIYKLVNIYYLNKTASFNIYFSPSRSRFEITNLNFFILKSNRNERIKEFLEKTKPIKKNRESI